MRFDEIALIKPKPPQTPEQAKVAGLKQGVDKAQDALKVERARQQRTKAQQQLLKVSVPKLS